MPARSSSRPTQTRTPSPCCSRGRPTARRWVTRSATCSPASTRPSVTCDAATRRGPDARGRGAVVARRGAAAEAHAPPPHRPGLRHPQRLPDAPPRRRGGGRPGARPAALIGAAPDAPAGTWVHWVLFNQTATLDALPENVPRTETLPQLGGTFQGRNDFGKLGYGGPCPPPGKPHRYFFKLYALDAKLGLKAGATKADVERAMKGHILAQAQLIGKYGR